MFYYVNGRITNATHFWFWLNTYFRLGPEKCMSQVRRTRHGLLALFKCTDSKTFSSWQWAVFGVHFVIWHDTSCTHFGDFVCVTSEMAHGRPTLACLNPLHFQLVHQCTYMTRFGNKFLSQKGRGWGLEVNFNFQSSEIHYLRLEIPGIWE